MINGIDWTQPEFAMGKTRSESLLRNVKIDRESFERVRLSAAPYIVDVRLTARLESRAPSKPRRRERFPATGSLVTPDTLRRGASAPERTPITLVPISTTTE
jgi:hypothetical protein